jgi:hypothetical protein
VAALSVAQSVELPLNMDFASGKDFRVGPLNGQQGWKTEQGTAQIQEEEGTFALQELGLRGHEKPRRKGGERNLSIAMKSDFGHVGCARSAVTEHVMVQDSVLRQDSNTVYRDGV